MHWKDALPPLKDPPDHIKIKVIADIFEAWIGAIIQQDNGLVDLEEWWCHNMLRVIHHTACLLFNTILHRYVLYYLRHHMGKYLTC
jgi:dsRNA-specific ribonuclease